MGDCIDALTFYTKSDQVKRIKKKMDLNVGFTWTVRYYEPNDRFST